MLAWTTVGAGIHNPPMKIQYQDQHTTVFESALFRTTATLIVTDDLVLLADPNWLPAEIDYLKKKVKEVRGDKPLYLLFTHSDYDHIIGYRAFDCDGIIASRTLAENPDKEKILQQVKAWDDHHYIRRNYPLEYPVADILIEKDGDQLVIGNTHLTFYLAPGHNYDGLFTIVEPLGIWIAGDYLSNIEFPYIYYSSYQYEETIHKTSSILTEHSVRLLISGHGDCTQDQHEMTRRFKDALSYIRLLRDSVKTGIPFDFNRLMKQYEFPLIMQGFHEGNEQLMRKELEK